MKRAQLGLMARPFKDVDENRMKARENYSGG
jgi:hypothetical protein